MDFENISKGFVYAVAVYLIVLVYGLNFILSNLAFGGLTPDFWLITLIILLPLMLSVLYTARSRIEFLYGKALLLKRLITVFIIIAAVLVVFLILPLSY